MIISCYCKQCADRVCGPWDHYCTVTARLCGLHPFRLGRRPVEPILFRSAWGGWGEVGGVFWSWVHQSVQCLWGWTDGISTPPPHHDWLYCTNIQQHSVWTDVPLSMNVSPCLEDVRLSQTAPPPSSLSYIILCCLRVNAVCWKWRHFSLQTTIQYASYAKHIAVSSAQSWLNHAVSTTIPHSLFECTTWHRSKTRV